MSDWKIPKIDDITITQYVSMGYNIATVKNAWLNC